LTGRMTPGRIFATALLLGTAFSVSMKTTYLVFFLAIAGTITWLLAGRPISKSLPAHVLALAGGVLVVPGAIVAYFASQGALRPLYHCVIEHNTMPGESLSGGILHRLFNPSTLWLILAWICTAAILPSVRQDPTRGYRRLF